MYRYVHPQFDIWQALLWDCLVTRRVLFARAPVLGMCFVVSVSQRFILIFCYLLYRELRLTIDFVRINPCNPTA